jgi:rhodanese-related sulfurtransferase
MKSITVEELKQRREQGAPHLLLDVREPGEVRAAAISASLNVPMNEVARRLGKLPKHREIVVMCAKGGRSARITAFLSAEGFPKAVNLEGGIEAWSRRIDPGGPAADPSLGSLWKTLLPSRKR